MAGGDVIDRDQGQAQVAYFLQQSMQRRLVGYRWALTAFEAGLIMLTMIIIWFGPEAKDCDFLKARKPGAFCDGCLGP